MKRVNQEVLRLVQYTKSATDDELMEDYGIELLPNGEVFDTVEDKRFKTVFDWAEDLTRDDTYDDYMNDKYKPRSKYEEEDAH